VETDEAASRAMFAPSSGGTVTVAVEERRFDDLPQVRNGGPDADLRAADEPGAV